ncbi:sensor histidine kinase [Lysinibacillus capsici]|uniref:sensor histidine kinase n=1 Tax=Lysinibacillus capsici TaxID=2115968 RepID=UPI002480E520|nr:HAMP domain-containing sensor histidine kinase [Lysinibacillus capsici]
METVKPRKGTRLHTFFLRYLFFLCIGIIILVALLIGLFMFAFSANIILPANYAETQITLAKDRIATSSSVTDEMIPDLVDYAVISNKGEFLSGTLTEKEASHAWRLKQRGETKSNARFYAFVEREQEVCILRYGLVPEYRTPVMRKYLPNPQLTVLLLFIIGVIIQATVLAVHFGRRLKRKMMGLQEAIEKIQHQNLDFHLKPSGIREIDDIALSFEQMKEALNTSLTQQWQAERARREQISALAHDLKTPLTIIRGNAELLLDTVQDEVQKEYNTYILKNTLEIEKFTKQLLDISNMEQRVGGVKTTVELASFIQQLEQQMKALALEKNIEVIVVKDKLPDVFMIEEELFYRALLNLIVNAIEHTPYNSKVTLSVQGEADVIHFTVIDSGAGFSPQDVKEATKQFYRGDPSRNTANHHGMGLYIVESIIQKHGGTLTLANDSITGGGKVIITIATS